MWVEYYLGEIIEHIVEAWLSGGGGGGGGVGNIPYPKINHAIYPISQN